MPEHSAGDLSDTSADRLNDVRALEVAAEGERFEQLAGEDQGLPALGWCGHGGASRSAHVTATDNAAHSSPAMP